MSREPSLAEQKFRIIEGRKTKLDILSKKMWTSVSDPPGREVLICDLSALCTSHETGQTSVGDGIYPISLLGTLKDRISED